MSQVLVLLRMVALVFNQLFPQLALLQLQMSLQQILLQIVQSLELLSKAPAGATVVTPATTLFVEVKEKNPEIKTTDLASALGLEDINILEFNPFSSGADPEKALTAEKVSSQIITTLTSISAAGEGAGASQEVAYEKSSRGCNFRSFSKNTVK